MGFIGDMFGGGGKDSSKASIEAANIAADAQTEALDYLKEVDVLPRQYREGALAELSDTYGLGDGEYAPTAIPGSELAAQGPAPALPRSGIRGQEELIAEARNSPLYSAIMGGREAGEEAVLRGKGATGGLRSGAAIGALTDYGSQLENRALLGSYDQAYRQELDTYGREVDQYGREVTAYDRQYGRDIDQYGRDMQGYGLEYGQYQDRIAGLSGLAGVPSQAQGIAGLTAGIGQTRAQGLVAGAQARQAGNQAAGGNLMGLGQLAMQAYSMSDIRLKQNIEHVGERNGHNWYTWDWSEGAKELGLEGAHEGYMAHEIFLVMPEACGHRDGFITLDYEMLEDLNATVQPLRH